MNIVHFSLTQLAGHPIRRVNALQKHSPHSVRLIQPKRWSTFAQDIVLDESPEEAYQVAQQADIIHLHNHIDLDTTDFLPIDFRALKKKNKFFIREFSAAASRIAGNLGISQSELISSPMPSIVAATSHERHFPNSLVIPFTIPHDEASYLPLDSPLPRSILHTPTSPQRSAWIDRWHTKGAPETLTIMRRVQRRTGCEIQVVTNVSFPQVLEARRSAGIVIDEMVTGGYHMTGLEALSMGKPTVAYIDDRTRDVIHIISGSTYCPFVNTRLEDSEEILVYLINHPDVMQDLGKVSREWIEQYWNEKRTTNQLLDVYRTLVVDPDLVKRQDELRCYDRPAYFFQAITIHDMAYLTRVKLGLSIKTKILYKLNGLLGQIRAFGESLRSRIDATQIMPE